MNIGYARVSTEDQHCENQIEHLIKAGCDPKYIYRETASGGTWDRPQLHKALGNLREGDVLVVWKLDRLSRSLGDLMRILTQVDHARASFKSLTETIDTTGACGKLMMHLLGAFNEFELSLIKERTKAGLQRARAKGHIGGATFKLSKVREAHAIQHIREGKTQTQVAEDQGVSKATISRLVLRAKQKGLL